jgi:alkylation response protein AidB-like acyl-CoA dehydrogenase
MAFSYQPLIGGELFDMAERFSEDADARLAGVRDAIARDHALGELWRDVERLGWPQSLIPEAWGGAGGTLEDALALVEGAGRFALPVPAAKSLLMAPRLLDGQVLGEMAAADVRLAVVLDGAYPWREASGVRLTDGRIEGAVLGTEDVPGATHYLVAADDRLALIAANRVEVRRHRRIDGRIAADLRFDKAVPDARYAGEGIGAAIDLAALAACIEIVAGAATVIEDTVRYLNERHQFGVALSSFQVLRHYVADMYIAYQNAHAVTAAALRGAIASPANLPWREIALAKLRAGEVGRSIAETSIQCHGGMGMTEENRATRIGKRLIMADLEWGDRAWLSERLLADRNLAA